MAQQFIVTTPVNSGNGTPLANAFNICNSNFSQLFARVQTNPPASLIGAPGDMAGMYAYDSVYFYYCFADYDGSTNIWGQITQSGGNVTPTQIQFGTTQVNIPAANANVAISVNGTSNVAVFNNGLITASVPISATANITGANVLTTGYVSAVGNVSGSYIYGNGAFLTGITGNGGGGNGTAIVNGLSSVNIPVSAGNVVFTVGFSSNVVVVSSAAVSVNGVVESTTVSATGNVSAGNITTVGQISATGNVSAGNVTTAGQISATANITGAYIIGDGSLLTNISGGGNYSNANVAAYLPTYSGNLTAGNLSVAGQANVTGNVNVNYASRINGTVNGQLYGLVNGVNTTYGTWDFGFISANTYDNPIQWIFAQTAAGNVDMGTVTAPASLDIDIGTIF